MYLLFDIGGTKTRIGLSQDLKSIEKPTIIETHQDFHIALNNLVHTALTLAGNTTFQGVAGGVAGILSADKSQLFKAPNLPLWNNLPIKQHLEGFLKAPIFIENDAALCGLGEALHGPGKGQMIVAYLTVSTGVGGARIVNGRIDVSAHGFEPGHQIISFENYDYSHITKRGELEYYVAGSGGGLKQQQAYNPTQQDDQAFWDEVAKKLAVGLTNTIVHWSPQMVILGGAVMKSISIDATRKHLSDTLTIFPQLPQLELSTLGDHGGLYGAMEYLKQCLEV